MKKIILLTAMLLAMTSSIQAENKLTASIEKNDDASLIELVISMQNDIEVGGYDFHLYLPIGIDLVYDSAEEEYIYVLSDRHNKKHQLTIKYDETDNSYMLGVADPSLHKIAVGNGEIIRLRLIVNDPTLSGIYDGSIRNIWFAEDGSNGVEVEDLHFGIPVAIHEVLGAHKATSYYNLAGQMVNHKFSNRKLQRGVYVTEGKKVIKK